MVGYKGNAIYTAGEVDDIKMDLLDRIYNLENTVGGVTLVDSKALDSMLSRIDDLEWRLDNKRNTLLTLWNSVLEVFKFKNNKWHKLVNFKVKAPKKSYLKLKQYIVKNGKNPFRRRVRNLSNFSEELLPQ